MLQEVQIALTRESLTTVEGALRLVATIRRVLHSAEVSGYSHLIGSMPINPGDQHVLAAAVTASAQVIVTKNLKDFSASSLTPYGLEAKSPDAFLVDLHGLDPDLMAQVIAEQSAALSNPQMTVADVLDTLTARGAPTFAALVRERMPSDGL